MRVTRRSVSRCAGGERRVDGQALFAIEVGDDRLAVADRLAIVNDVGKLPARRRRGVEDVLVNERHAREFEEGVDLEPIAVVVGDAEKGGVGVKGEHCGVLREADAAAMTHRRSRPPPTHARMRGRRLGQPSRWSESLPQISHRTTMAKLDDVVPRLNRTARNRFLLALCLQILETPGPKLWPEGENSEKLMRDRRTLTQARSQQLNEEWHLRSPA